jgi:hypothetical protein
MVVNFITFKWGKKYSPVYVNRVYWTMRALYTGEFIFHCITDNSEELDKDIVTHDIKEIAPLNSVFCTNRFNTFSKDFKIKGNKILFDIDGLIQKDLYLYLKEYNFCEPRFVEPIWQNKNLKYRNYHNNSCMVNSSFITWKDDQLHFIYEFYNKNKKLIDMKYGPANSSDRILFNLFYDILKFHPKGIIYSYSFGAEYPDDLEIEKYRPKYYMSTFLTSHGTGTELHDANPWVIDMWKRYDS